MTTGTRESGSAVGKGTTGLLLRLLVALGLLVALVACGDESGDAVDSSGSGNGSAGPMPDRIPAAPGTVTTAYLATVMDTGEPELCLGAVAESWPPQCSGVPMAGWKWREHPEHERQGSTRWGSFAVTGTWDGTTFTAESAIPAALYDVPPDETPTRPTPSVTLTETELTRISERLVDVPGFLTASPEETRVVLGVVYDDGSLQQWADETWRTDVVVVESALVTADG